MWKKVIKANEMIAGSFMAQLMHNVTIFTYLVERKESFKIQAFFYFLFFKIFNSMFVANSPWEMACSEENSCLFSLCTGGQV